MHASLRASVNLCWSPVPSPVDSHLTFWDRVFQWTWCTPTGLHPGQPASSGDQPGSYPSLQCWDYRHALPPLSFYWGSWNQILVIAQQALYSFSNSFGLWIVCASCTLSMQYRILPAGNHVQHQLWKSRQCFPSGGRTLWARYHLCADGNQNEEEPPSSCHRLTGYPFWSKLLAMGPDIHITHYGGSVRSPIWRLLGDWSGVLCI